MMKKKNIIKNYIKRNKINEIDIKKIDIKDIINIDILIERAILNIGKSTASKKLIHNLI